MKKGQIIKMPDWLAREVAAEIEREQVEQRKARPCRTYPGRQIRIIAPTAVCRCCTT